MKVLTVRVYTVDDNEPALELLLRTVADQIKRGHPNGQRAGSVDGYAYEIETKK